MKKPEDGTDQSTDEEPEPSYRSMHLGCCEVGELVGIYELGRTAAVVEVVSSKPVLERRGHG